MHDFLRSRCFLLLMVAAVMATPAFAQSQTAERDKQIAELEKKLAALKQQLFELQKADAAATATAPRPLQLADAVSWKRIGFNVALTRDGVWFAYRVGPSDGEGEVVVRETHGDKEYRFPGGEGGFGALSFSHDGKWLAFAVAPAKKSGGPAGPKKTGAAPPPATSTSSKAVLVNLASGAKVEFEGIRRFAFDGEASTSLALQRAPASPAQVGPPAPQLPPSPGPAPAPTGDRPGGSDLILRDLATGQELTFGNVGDFAFDKMGHWMALAIETRGETGSGVQLRNMKTGAVQQIDSGKALYQSLAWTEKGDGLTALKGIEDKQYKDRLYCVLAFTGFDRPAPKKTVYDPRQDKSFPAGMTVSPNRPPSFSDDLGTLFFGIHELKKADDKSDGKSDDKAEAKTAESSGKESKQGKVAGGKSAEKPDLVIWHWNDERLQPMQQVQAAADRNFSYLCAYRVKEGKFLRLADDARRQVTIAPKQRYGVGLDNKPYLRQGNLDGRRFQDIYVVDLQTGARRLALKKNRWYMGPSPAGTHLLYYDDGHFHTYDMTASTSVNITREATVSFVDTEDDHAVDRPPTRPFGWSKDGQAVLLSDNWDVWQLPVGGGTAGVNLTGDGRRDGIRYRTRIPLDPDEKGIDLSVPQYFTCLGEWTKKSGFARWTPVTAVATGGNGGSEGQIQSALTRLCWEDAQVGALVKARNADVFVFTRETAKDYPDYHVADGSFSSCRKLTDVGTRQTKVIWSSGSMLLDYKSAKGDRLQGALFLPANCEKGKSYPTIVNIYERLSQNLYRYTAPSVGGGFNAAIYTSNGYAVLMPDIKYTVNDPGMSAVWCVLPALEAAIKTGVVDGKRVGLHGHSWGGYQTSFLITQSDAFRAAVAGAPLTNLVSMYSSIYWNTGSANQPIFESSQGRFTSGYSDNWEAYVRNSPVFHAKNVKTPLLLLHNDKDGAVDFTQGIEYFNTLRRLDKPVVMLQYKGENHGLAKPANQRDYAVRMREFFDHHLMDKPAPAWLREGVPHLKIDEHLTERGKRN